MILDNQRRCRCDSGFLCRDEFLFQHPVDHPVSAGNRSLFSPDRVIIVRTFRQGRQIGDFGNGQVIQAFIKIVQGRSGNAIGPIAQINLVQIQFQDAVLIQRAFDAQRQNGLFHFSCDGHFICQQKVFCHLLRDCGRPNQPPPLCDMDNVGDNGADQCLNIHTKMPIEILILCRDEAF